MKKTVLDESTGQDGSNFVNSYFGLANLPLFLSLVIFGQKVHVFFLIISDRGHLVLGDDLIPGRREK